MTRAPGLELPVLSLPLTQTESTAREPWSRKSDLEWAGLLSPHHPPSPPLLLLSSSSFTPPASLPYSKSSALPSFPLS